MNYEIRNYFKHQYLKVLWVNLVSLAFSHNFSQESTFAPSQNVFKWVSGKQVSWIYWWTMTTNEDVFIKQKDSTNKVSTICCLGVNNSYIYLLNLTLTLLFCFVFLWTFQQALFIYFCQSHNLFACKFCSELFLLPVIISVWCLHQQLSWSALCYNNK